LTVGRYALGGFVDIAAELYWEDSLHRDVSRWSLGQSFALLSGSSLQLGATRKLTGVGLATAEQ